MFEIISDDIAALDDVQLREVLAKLCEADCRHNQMSPSGITWGGDQNASDGGIDVLAELPDDGKITGFIPRMITGFQAKATDMPPSAIMKEMTPKGRLLESIKEIADDDGAYIIVSSQGSVSESARTRRKNAMAAAIATWKSDANIHLDFYDRTRVATWVNQHPSLISYVREILGKPLDGWQPFKDWSSSPSSIDDEYVLHEGITVLATDKPDNPELSTLEGIQEVRGKLCQSQRAIRLVGLSGVGKTRFVQALFDDRIGTNALNKTQVLYTDISDSPDPSPVQLATQLGSQGHENILIVDNCGPDLHRKLVNIIKSGQTRLSLITIEYDITDDEPEGTNVYKLEPTSTEHIEKILEIRFPNIAQPSLSIIAEFSGGNARIAFALANTMRPGNSLVNLKDSELFKRLFEQRKGKTENLLNTAKIASLVYSFDGENFSDTGEISQLAAFIEMTPKEFGKQLAQLNQRQLLQKRGIWRAILPHAVANRLAAMAIDEYQLSDIEELFLKPGNERLMRSFAHRIGFLHDNQQANSIVTRWLGPDGILYPINALNEEGLKILRYVSAVNPKAVLQAIQGASADEKFYTPNNPNRHVFVRILKLIAYDSNYFDESAECLVNFSLHDEVDNQNRSDRPIDYLKSLFFLYLSGTHALPDQRRSLVSHLLGSDDTSALGLELLGALLHCNQFNSFMDFKFGARHRDFGWRPKINGDVYNWYDDAIDLALEAAQKPNCHEQVKKLLAKNFRGLWSRAGSWKKLSAIVQKIDCNGHWPELWLAIRTTIKFDKNSMSNDSLVEIIKIEKLFSPKNLADEINSHVLVTSHGGLDIVDVEVDDDYKNYDAVQEKIQFKCIELGKLLAADTELRKQLFPEILKSQAHRAFTLGMGLGQSEDVKPIWQELKAAFIALGDDAINVNFLGGFFKSLSDTQNPLAQGMLDEILDTEKLCVHYPYLQGCYSLDGPGINRLFEALKNSSIPASAYATLAYGRTLDALTEKQLIAFLTGLMNRENHAKTVMNMFVIIVHIYSQEKRHVTNELLKLGRDILSKVEFDRDLNHSGYKIGELASVCFREEASEPVARQLCEKLLLAAQSWKISIWDYGDVISKTAKHHPFVVLDVFVEKNDYSGIGASEFFREIRQFRGDPLNEIPVPTLLEWVDKKPETRIEQLASVVKYYIKNEGSEDYQWSQIALHLVELSEDKICVLEIFYNRFSPSSYSGNLSAVLIPNLSLLVALETHDNEEIRQWSYRKKQEFIDYINQVRKNEEERDRKRNESFED